LEHESDSLFAFISSSRRVGIQRPEYDETFNDILDNEEADLIGAAFLRTGTSAVQDNILYYIAGFILRKMSKFLLECETCYNSLFCNQVQQNTSEICLTERKNRGGLLYASESTFLVIKANNELAFRYNDFNYRRVCCVCC
jgi:hypothetical protein